jgi:hypothetical protein
LPKRLLVCLASQPCSKPPGATVDIEVHPPLMAASQFAWLPLADQMVQ